MISVFTGQSVAIQRIMEHGFLFQIAGHQPGLHNQKSHTMAIITISA
jgi:hypothetical protein